ncbi:Membrane-bound lysozyme inhibitor of C-type lysozyme precursor [Pseudogemmobacter humi]|uniref:Membrane-bound lysozyme inhibitor of C-type lysozyme n=2 Tax=Pseudogemmobacter humi TaxID=2483812 RepID=A0A3P5XAU2_9RHOB|nr:Membrane-bound lysozyme inhibitor of C-type lysozyme precursor [Pseudogemmobacter humi]
MRIYAAALVALGALPAAAGQTDFATTRYLCDRGVEVPATYVNADDLSLAVIHVEGAQNTLVNEPSASGARYGWPSDGAHYVWWTKGDEATLYWAERGEETQLLSCKAQE